VTGRMKHMLTLVGVKTLSLAVTTLGFGMCCGNLSRWW
jgi:hypothetical protein